MSNTIQIAVLADVRRAVSGIDSVNSKLGTFGKTAGRIGGVLKGALAGAAVGFVGTKLVGFLSDATSKASELEQSTGAIDAVFGKSARGIKKSAASAAGAFGLSQNAYQELASTLGAGFKNQGIKDFAGQTKNVIGLGADLAAQFGGSTSDAVSAIGSLMRGEADPIERYGVSIKESAISAELAARGQSNLKGAALEQAKAQARLSLLFKQTKDAQGAFARESDTVAGKAARNAATWENTQARLGKAFLPIASIGQDLVAKALPHIERFFGFIAAKAPGVIASVQGFFSGLKGDGSAATYIGTLKQVFSTLWAVVVDVAGAIKANFPAIKSAVLDTYNSIKDIFANLAKFWKVWGPTISSVVATTFTTVIQVISGAVKVISGVIKVFTSILTGDWKGAWQGIRQIVQGQLQIAKALIGNILNQALAVAKGILKRIGVTFTGTWKDILAGIGSRLRQIGSDIKAKLNNARATVVNTLNNIKRGFSIAWASIRTNVSNAWNNIVSTVRSRINSARSSLASGWSNTRATVSREWGNIVSTVRTRINNVIESVRALPGRIRGYFANAGSWLLGAGRRIISGLLSGLNSMIGAVRSKLSALTNLIPSWKGPAKRDAKLLTKAGELIMGSLVTGFEKGQGAVRTELRDLTKYLSTSMDEVMSPTLTPSLDMSSAVLAGPGVGGVTYHMTVEVNTGVGDPVAIGREIERNWNAFKKSGGRTRA